MNNNLITKYKFILIFTLFVVSCNTLKKNNLIFQKENQKIILELENGKTHLKWDEKTKLKLKTENIDNRRLSISAPGLRFLERANEKNESILEITPERKYIKNDTLNLFVSCRDLKDSIWIHKFKILIK